MAAAELTGLSSLKFVLPYSLYGQRAWASTRSVRCCRVHVALAGGTALPPTPSWSVQILPSSFAILRRFLIFVINTIDYSLYACCVWIYITYLLNYLFSFLCSDVSERCLWLAQSRQQVESDAAELRRQIDGLKDEVDTERRKQSTFEQRISELNEKLRNAENTVSTTSSQLVRESSSLDVLNKTKVDYSTSSLFIFENNLIIHFDMCFWNECCFWFLSTSP